MKMVLIATVAATHDGNPVDWSDKLIAAFRREIKLRLLQHNEQGGMELSRDLDGAAFSDIKIIVGE